jgi:hypothetical protein
MNNTEINKILEKYWDAETTIQEEKQLLAYFKSGNIASEHVQYQDLFHYYNYVANIQLEDKIISLPARTRFGIRRNIIGLAASLIFMLSAGFFFVNNYINGPVYHENTIVITEEEEAMQITKDALAFLSIKLDESSRNITSDVQKMGKVSILK